jgi:hypothetical protein
LRVASEGVLRTHELATCFAVGLRAAEAADRKFPTCGLSES